MTWANLALCSFHAAVDDAQATPWTADEAMTSGYPLTNLHDWRMQTQARWSTSDTDHWLELDRGTSISTAVDRLILVNHNLFLKKVKVMSGNSSPAATTEQVASVTVFATAGAQEMAVFDFAGSTSHRYIRISFPTSAVQPQIGQAFVTETETLTNGPVQDWQYAPVMDRQIFPDGSMVENNPVRQRLGISFRKTTASDLTKMKRMITGYGLADARHNGARPLVVFAPYHTIISTGATTFAHVMDLVGFTEEADVQVPADADYLAKVEMEFLESLA